MDPWSYISPSSGDILNNAFDKEFSESYFEVDHENTNGRVISPRVPSVKSQNFVQPIKIKQEVISPNVQNQPTAESKLTAEMSELCIKKEILTPKEPLEAKRQNRRRSMSVSTIMQTTKTITQITHSEEITQSMEYSTSSSPNRDEYQSSRWKKMYDSSISKSLKSFSAHSSQSNLHVTSKFVSMAEAIYHLQRDTPKRFHSSSRIQDHRAVDAALNRKRVQQLKSTIPQSPALISKTRIRPVTALSQKDIEDLELEEIKKHHIKANPINKAVLHGLINIPAVQRKPITKPEPFNLTQIRKRPAPTSEKKNVFTARPIPRHILEKPAELPKKTIPITVPITPKVMTHRSRSLENVTKYNKEITPLALPRRARCPLRVSDKLDGILPEQSAVGHSGVPLAQKVVLHPCKLKPFSFEQRDKERQTKKMEKIQQVYDEERKMREFHANPVPSVIMKKVKISSPKSKLYERKNDSKKENKENVSEEHIFKARPPLVLFKEPFIPTRKERPVLEPCQIQLTTEIRARERDAFNQKIKEKEEQLEVIKKLEEEERLHREEEEKATLRAQLVHKAAPVKHYAPVVIHPSEVPLTRPEAPKFALHTLHKSS